ncbi:MAG: CoA-binding protein [Ignavibacteriales bacterium]|nr:CoA-binding protein [Ignavibacteriales bacterium]
MPKHRSGWCFKKSEGIWIYRCTIIKNSGCNVYAVNKNSIAGDSTNLFPKLSAIPVALDAIITTVPPDETMNVLNDAISLGIKKVWLQPGSDSKEVKTFAKRITFNSFPANV